MRPGKLGKRTAYVLLVTLEELQLLHRADVKDSDSLVSRSRSKSIPIRVPLDRLDRPLMIVSGTERNVNIAKLIHKHRRLTKSRESAPCEGPRI